MIKMIIFDVDGTLTDGKIYIGEKGEIMKCFDVKDGYGIHTLMPARNLLPVVITARTSVIVENRCKELGIIHCYQGCENKVKKLDEITKKLGYIKNQFGVYDEIAYIGDDKIDIEVMKQCALKGCPENAVKEVKQIVDFVSDKKGGDGAVREFIEWIISKI